jgi:hypothetical protein
MLKHLSVLLVVVLLTGRGALTAAAGQLAPPRVEFTGGTVTVLAQNARAADLLQEWSREGNVEVTGTDLLSERRVTLNLVGVPENEALEAVVGPGYSFMGAVKKTLASGTSRFSRIVVKVAASVTPEPLPSSSAPPEARFAYPKLGHAVSANDVLLTDAPTRSPSMAGTMPDPEAVFDYTAPQAGKLRDLRGELTGAVGAARPDVSSSLQDPEAVFEYSIPRRVQEALSRRETPASTTTTGTTLVEPRGDPETRFAYFQPAKAAPPKRTDPTAGVPDPEPLLALPGEEVTLTIPSAIQASKPPRAADGAGRQDARRRSAAATATNGIPRGRANAGR